jgi:hypothetical protein
MFACILAIHSVCAGGAPPESSRIDPASIYVMLLLSDLETIRNYDEDIQQLKARARRDPAKAERREKLILKCYEVRERALRSCYQDACGLLKEFRFRVRYDFQKFLVDWSAPVKVNTTRVISSGKIAGNRTTRVKREA